MTDAEVMAPRDNVTPQLVIGLGIMAAGLLMTLDVMGIIYARDYLRYWPVILIIIGAQNIAATGGRGRSSGVIQLFLGVWFLLVSLRALPRHWWLLFWPFVLMFAGGMLVLRTIRRHESSRLDSNDSIHMAGILGGSNRSSNANPFRGGEITAMMGGGKLDLRSAVIPAGQEAIIDVFCTMGGYELVVPDSWIVDDRTTTILGGNHDETHPRADASSRLVLRGFVMMGGCNIKN